MADDLSDLSDLGGVGTLTPPAPLAEAPVSASPAPEPADHPSFRFIGGEGNTTDRLKAIEGFLERIAPNLELVYLAYQNIQREAQRSTELWTYVCKGADSKGPNGLCNQQMQAKRPEFRTYADRLICKNPVHNGELTLMEPILPT